MSNILGTLALAFILLQNPAKCTNGKIETIVQGKERICVEGTWYPYKIPFADKTRPRDTQRKVKVEVIWK